MESSCDGFTMGIGGDDDGALVIRKAVSDYPADRIDEIGIVLVELNEMEELS